MIVKLSNFPMFLRALSHSLGRRPRREGSFTQSQPPSSHWTSQRQMRTSGITPCLGLWVRFCKRFLESGSYSDSLITRPILISKGIQVKISGLMSQQQISFPAAASSLVGQQCTDREGGILQLMQPVPTAIGEKVAYYLPEIFLILIQNNTNWIYYFSRAGTALVTCRRCFLTCAKESKPNFQLPWLLHSGTLISLPLKHRHRHESLLRQSSCYTSASQINCTQTHTIFHTYLKVAHLSFMGSSVLKTISVHKYHRLNIKTQHKYESRRSFNWYFNYWLLTLIKQTQHLDFTYFLNKTSSTVIDSFPEIFYAIFTGKWSNRVSVEKALIRNSSNSSRSLQGRMFFHICNEVDEMKNQILQETYSLYTVYVLYMYMYKDVLDRLH